MDGSVGLDLFLAAAFGLSVWVGVGVTVRHSVETPRVTAATWITILRGGLAATLIGVVVAGPVDGSDAWIVPVLFAIAGLLDAVDGPIARATETVSTFGERLDTEADGFIVLVGAILVVVEGLAPVWFLAVGAARYLFVAGCALRRRQGKPIGTDERRLPRVLIYAGTMVCIWIGLLPSTEPTLTVPLLSVAGIAMLGSFARSWLVVTGRL